jgi:hypothetical protein
MRNGAARQPDRARRESTESSGLSSFFWAPRANFLRRCANCLRRCANFSLFVLFSLQISVFRANLS